MSLRARLNASLGISAYPRDGNTADELISHADTAMCLAKDQGGNAMAFFTPEMNDSMVERLHIEAGLRRALEQQELRVYFQPIVSLATGKVTFSRSAGALTTPGAGAGATPPVCWHCGRNWPDSPNWQLGAAAGPGYPACRAMRADEVKDGRVCLQQQE